MGALDDAIREHLELKRQHGAAEEEIRRAEAEALGPARREPAPDPAFAEEPLEPVAESPEHAGAYAMGDPPPPAPMDAVADAPPPPPLEEDEVVEPPQPQPLEEPAAFEEPDALDEPVEFEEPDDLEEPDRRRTTVLDDPLDELAPPPAVPVHHEPDPDEPPAPARPVGQEPLMDEPPEPLPPAPAGASADEDVLEETPDFLQETPEHDRLWFEQKPPRDFDFDD